MRKDRPNRVLYEFWLDGAKDELQPIIYEFNHLRSRRRLSGRLITMAGLWFDLSVGRTDKLIECFPKFATRLKSDEDMLQAIYDQQSRILEKLERGITAPIPAQTGKVLSMAHIAMPVIDDDDDVIEKKADLSAGIDASKNFMKAAMSLIGDRDED